MPCVSHPIPVQAALALVIIRALGDLRSELAPVGPKRSVKGGTTHGNSIRLTLIEHRSCSKELII